MEFRSIHNKPYLKLKTIATLIDYGVFLGFYLAFLYVFDESTKEGEMAVTGNIILFIPLVWLLYFVALEAINQSTPGHYICKLKVYTIDGQKPGLISCLKRRLLDPIDLFIYGIPAFICISKTPNNQRLGDLWAGTLVAMPSDVVKTEVTF